MSHFDSSRVVKGRHGRATGRRGATIDPHVAKLPNVYTSDACDMELTITNWHKYICLRMPWSPTISNLQKSDTANYGCNATNSIGYVYKDVYVNVLALPPEIQNAPAKQSRTVEGQAVTINCQTFGAPKPIIKWYKDGRELLGHTDRYELLPNGNLIIK